jgi:enoyl-CoA hydratase
MRRAMEMMVTGDSVTGIEAAREGWANRAFPAEQLEAAVLEVAQRITEVPPELVQLNKRVVHRRMEHMGVRNGIRAGTELCALGTKTEAHARFLESVQTNGLVTALSERDKPFGDYRTTAR